MYDTMEQFWEAKYTEANDERWKYLRATSQMTGYFAALALYDDNMPNNARIRMLERLIELWHELDPASETTNEWTLKWQEKIKELRK